MNFKSNGKSIALGLILFLCLVSVFHLYQGSFRKERVNLSLSDFIVQVENGKIQEVVLRDQDIQGLQKDGTEFFTHAPRTFSPIPMLVAKGVRFKAEPQDTSSLTFLALIQIFLPLILFGGILYFFFRQLQNNSGKAIGFGKSRAKLSDPEKSIITFADVEGIDEAKEDLKEIVEFLKNPHKFQKIGARIPKGVLLVGPPGTGKTLLAKAVAGEARVPFFSISGSDFVEIFVGVGASRVRDLFTQARQQTPCILFVDEIDAVGRHRGVGMGGSNDEREQTLNQLLVEMDGFEAKEEVIVIAATNRADVLDPALLRPGRFDRQVSVELPDVRGREKILQVHMKNVQLGADVNPAVLARGTAGFSGADLANLVNEGALRAAGLNRKVVLMSDFEMSRDKLIMGPERSSLLLQGEEKRLTAYHEAGHAVVAYHSPESDPIHKATIIPRGAALGMVVRLPEGDQLFISKKRLMADLAVAMGGRIAEEVIFGPESITTGGSSDFQFATKIARNMVVDWGMSETLGPLSYTQRGTNSTELSDDLRHRIDEEVRKIVEAGYGRAQHILTTHRNHLDLVAANLLELETLTGEEVHQLIAYGKLDPRVEIPEPVESAPVSTKPSSSSKKSKRSTRSSPKTGPLSETPTNEALGTSV